MSYGKIFSLHSLSSSLLSTSPPKKTIVMKFFPRNIFSSTLLCVSLQKSTVPKLIASHLNLFYILAGILKSFIDCTIAFPLVLPIRCIPFLEIIKWIQICCITHQLTNLDNIYSYLKRILKRITITCPFSRIISIYECLSID